MTRVSPWFDCTTQPPVRSGWYEVRVNWHPKSFRLYYSWASECWTVGAVVHLPICSEHMNGLKWRGVLK